MLQILFLLLVLMETCTCMSTINLVAVYDAADIDILAAARYAVDLINTGRLNGAGGFTPNLNITAIDIKSNYSLTQTVCSNSWNWSIAVGGLLDLTKSNGVNVHDMAIELNVPFMSARWIDDFEFSTVRPNPNNYIKV